MNQKVSQLSSAGEAFHEQGWVAAGPGKDMTLAAPANLTIFTPPQPHLPSLPDEVRAPGTGNARKIDQEEQNRNKMRTPQSAGKSQARVVATPDVIIREG